MSSKEFCGKVVLITGASSGIGACVALHFANLGASLVLTGRNIQNLKKTEQKCSASPKIVLVTADVTKKEDIEKIVNETIKTFGKIDVLVNNAGIFELGSLEESNLEQLDRIFNTDIRAVFQLTKLVLPYLKTSKGNIVNISSIAGLRHVPDMISYSMAKSALDQFTKCLAMEQAANGVRVNSVNPAVIQTEIFGRSGLSEDKIKLFLDYQKELHPLGRVGQPEEVAEAITFLASERASFITGTLLPIDGGKNCTSGTLMPKERDTH